MYTKTGDTGETSLFGGGRVGKDDARVDAYGEVDELNAAVGLARAEGLGELDGLAHQLQEELFVLGAVLATPAGTKAEKVIPKLNPEWVSAMEKAIDDFDRVLTPLSSFILPGGTRPAAALHLARAVCRRAERKVVPLFRSGKIDSTGVVFLNRLSDLLFTMARVANLRAGTPDVPWMPKRG
ncbi:MAG: cob(I)yrinic acid a,c-diamide adenosyltransferase [Myxococcales bacterium]|nr:cob(I)yrinic acid a,c-diamide adenosyltransferase [Myxococcales bacterium]